MQKALRVSLPVLFSVLAFGASAPLAFAATISVDPMCIADAPTNGECNDSSTYKTIQSAISAATPGDTINVAEGIYELSAQLNISKVLSIVGSGAVTLKAVSNYGTTNGSKHLLTAYTGTEATPVTISNVTLDCNSNCYGFNTYSNAYVVLDGVTVTNSRGAGLTVNGSTVVATNLNTSGNAWGAVNVDPGNGVTTPSAFTLNSGTLAEGNQIWSDGSHVTSGATVTVSATGYNEYSYAGSAAHRWANGAITNAAWIASAPTVLYSTIQPAIDSATSGDTINVAAGTYNLTSRIDVNKAVSLGGDVTTPANVVINAPTAGGTQHGQNSVFMVTASDVNIQGFRIQGALHTGAAQNAGIYVDDPRLVANPGLSNITISNNELTNNGWGIFVHNIKDSTISNNKVYGNKSTATAGKEYDAGSGIVVYGRAQDINHTYNLTIDNNQVYSNETEGIRVDVSSDVGASSWVNDLAITISNNIVHDNGRTIGGVDKYIGIKSAGFSKGVIVSGNEIYGHVMGASPTNTNQSSGVWIAPSNSWQITNNNIHNNTNGIIFVYSYAGSGNHTITGNDIHENLRGISINDGSIATANNNSIYSNGSTAFSGIGFAPYGVYNSGAGFGSINSWWGNATGPSGSGSGTGDAVSANVTVAPWYTDAGMTMLSSTLHDIFTGIATTLSGPSLTIASNIGDVTASNYKSFPSLYFEKSIDGIPVGKITFSSGLDLSDPNTQTFLQNLGNVMEQSSGHIAFNVGSSEFAGKGAALEMYNMPAGITQSQIVVRTDSGNIMSPTGIVGSFAQDPTTGDVTFSATHFTQFDIDTIPPMIDGHADVTAEGTPTLGATATYTSPATTDNISPVGTATCEPASGSPFAFGDTQVTCTATDAAGNNAIPVTFVVHVVDTTPPAIPVISTPAQFASTTDMIHIVGTAETDSTVTITGGASTATGSATGGNYDIVVTLTHNAVNTLSVTAKDASNNVSVAATVAITHDNVAPTGTIVINEGAAYTNSVSHQVNLVLSANADLSGVTQMNIANTSSYAGWESYNGSKTWTLSVDDGQKTVRVKFMDAAGNVTATGIPAIITVDTAAPATPVISTPAQSVNTNTIHIIGTAEDNSTATVTGGASTASGVATGGVYDIVVTLTHNSINNLSVTTKDAANNVSTAATVAITHDDTSVAPASLAVGSPTQTTLALSWTNGESNGSYYTIKRSVTPIIDDASFAAATSLGGAPTPASGTQGYVAKNLTAGTTYYFAIKITDAVGNVSAMSTANGTTASPDAPAPTDSVAPAAVTDLSAMDGATATSQIVLDWSAAGDDASTGIATKYIVKRSTSTITAGTFDAATTVFNSISPSAPGSNETLTVSGLTSGTQYCFAVKVQDEASNTSTISNSVCHTTSNLLPTVTIVSPVTNQNDSAMPITITGTNFVTGTTTVRLTNSSNTFDLVGAFVDSTHVTATVPVGAPAGVYGVRVIDGNGTSNAFASAYTITNAPIPWPAVTDVVPSTIGNNDADVNVEIYGTSFTGATGAVLDTGAPTTLTNFVVVSDTKITATIPGTLSAGTYNVKVTNASGTNTVSAVQITVNAPVVIDSATTQDQVTDKPVDMGTDNTIPVQITMQSNADDSTLDNNTTIEVIIPPATTVTTIDDKGDTVAYTGNINPPQLVKPTEEIAAAAGDNSVVITMGNPNETINFSQNFVTTVTLETTNSSAPLIWYYNPSSGLSIAGIEGDKDGVHYVPGGTVLNTVNNGGTYTHTIGLLLNHMSSYVAGVTPTITGTSHTSSIIGTTITISGTNFSPGAVVRFGDTTATVTANSVTEITTSVPVIEVGSYVITVTNTDNLSATAPNNFTVQRHNSSASATPATRATRATPTVSPATPATPATPTRGRVLGAAVYNFTKSLAVGSQNADVTALQQYLIDNGYSVPAGATGYFGAQTRAAVLAFQKAKGIAQVGVVGPATRAELNKGEVATTPEVSNADLTASVANGLTSVQEDAIIGLLQAFGADETTIAQVRAALAK